MERVYKIFNGINQIDRPSLIDKNIIILNDNTKLTNYLKFLNFKNHQSFTTSRFTKAEWYYSELNAIFHLPYNDKDIIFSFIANKNNIIIIDNNEIISKYVEDIIKANIKLHTVGEFVYILLEEIISDDLDNLEKIEESLINLETKIFNKDIGDINEELEKIRKKIIHLSSDYIELIDLADILLDNEDNLFNEASILEINRWIRKVERLKDETKFLNDYSMQIREVYQAELDLRQNNIMRILTVVTIITLPITLISAWYGMNFSNMHELNFPFAYPLVIILTLIITLLVILYLKKKKYL